MIVQLNNDGAASGSAASYETEGIVLAPRVVEGLRNLAAERQLPLPAAGAALFALAMCRGVDNPSADFGVVTALNEEALPVVVETDGEEPCFTLLARISDALRKSERSAAGAGLSCLVIVPERPFDDLDPVAGLQGRYPDCTLFVYFDLQSGIVSLTWRKASLDRVLASAILTGIRWLATGLPSQIADPVRSLSLTDQRRPAELKSFSSGRRAPVPQTTVLQMFEQQAVSAPSRTALVHEAQSVSYGELKEIANAIAVRLRAAGVVPNDRIGVLMRKSPELIASLLAIWQCGAAWVMLDAEWPRMRTSFVASDAGVKLMLTDEACRELVPENSASLIWSESAVADPHGVIGAPTEFSAIAYILYTSGSTGEPKGAAVRHSSIVNLALDFKEALSLTPNDVVLAMSPLTFDASVGDIFPALSAGAAVVLTSALSIVDAEKFDRIVRRHGVTFAFGTPSFWRALLDSGWTGASSLRIISGGEPLDADLAGRLLRTCQVLWNGYGPTETTVYATVKRVISPRELNIGLPIRNGRVYVLDRFLAAVPNGMWGELCIGGEGVAAGYVNRPELNAARFVRDPFADRPDERMYRTADIGRILPSGEIQYFGRIDNQLKINGNRIEPGEVEAALRMHPAIRNAVVLGKGGRVSTSLGAWLELEPGSAMPENAELKIWLRQRLPAYMVPASFFPVEHIPLNENGKTDRRYFALTPENAKTAPANETEQVLQSIWKDILKIDAPGVEDDFFELGGTSLLAVLVLSRVKAHFGREILLTAFLPGMTIRSLARLIADSHVSQGVISLRTGRGTPLFLLPGISGHLLTFRHLINKLDDRPAYGFHEGNYQRGAALRSIQEIAAGCVIEIRRVQPAGPYLIGGFSFGGTVAYEIAQQLRASGESTALLILFDAFAPDITASLSATRKIAYQLRRARMHAKSMARLSFSGRIQYIRARWRELAWQANVPVLQNALLTLRATGEHVAANLAAMKNYRPSPYPGSVLIIRSREKGLRQALASDLGWGRHLSGEIRVSECEGNHDTMLSDSNVAGLARTLVEEIERVEEYTAAACSDVADTPPRPLRIGNFQVGYPEPDGITTAVKGLARALADRGHQVTIYGCGQGTSAERECPGVSVHMYPWQSRNPFGVPRRLLARIAENTDGLDLLFLNSMFHPSNVAMARAARKAGIPYVICPHDPYHPALLKKNWLRKFIYGLMFEKPMLRRSAAVQLLSPTHEQHLRAFGIRVPSVTVPNGFHPDELPPDFSGEPLAGHPALLVLGRLDPQHKGQDLLLQALALMRRRGQLPVGLRVHIVGPQTEHGPELARLTEELELSDVVQFHGRVSEEVRWTMLNTCDALLLCSRHDGFGLVVLEAMLCGRPVLVSDQAGIVDWVRHARCGFDFSPEPASIASALGDFLEQREQWREMGERGRSFARSRMTWDAMAQAAQRQYSALVGPLPPIRRSVTAEPVIEEDPFIAGMHR